MFGRRKTPRLSGRIDTLLGRGTTLTGDLEFSGGLHIDGMLRGNVRGAEAATPATLWVGEPGRVHGNVDVAVAVINGEVVGHVRGTERVVLGAQARITGDVSYGVVEITLGARVEGKLVPLASTSGVSESPRSANVVRPFDVRQGRL